MPSLDMRPVTLIIRSNPFFERFQEWNPSLDTSMPVYYEMEIALDFNSKTALSEIQNIIYSDTLRIPEPHIIEEINRTHEAGATGEEYQIIIDIFTQFVANSAVEILKKLFEGRKQRTLLDQNEAFNNARTYLASKTRLPFGYFDLVSSQASNESYIFLFHEKNTNKDHQVCIGKYQPVVEYSVNIV